PRPLPAIHLLGQPSNRRQPFLRSVTAVFHEAEDAGEPLEVEAFGGDQWVFFEERNNPPEQIRPPLHGEAEKELPMVVVPGVLDQVPTPEHPNEEFERRS